MNIESIGAAIASALAAFLTAWLFVRSQLRAAETERLQLKQTLRELEAESHEQQREAASERNRLELEYQERSKTVRASVFEEGRQLGLAEAQRERVTELTAQQVNFAQRLAAEREEVARDTRERTRAEFELQAKLFDVSVRPYLKVDKVKGLLKDEEVVEAGYQYQLLVNGIPAFQPSVIIEETRRSSMVNEENINALLQVAERTAKTAVELYLGAGASAAKLGPAIIRRVVR
jgi:hypothetical protein